MKLKELIEQISFWKDWQKIYRENVSLFIQEAQNCDAWDEWDKGVFDEYFHRANKQSVSSIRRNYLSKKEQSTIKEHWHEVAPLLKRIALEQDEPQFDLYRKLESVIHSYNDSSKKRAAVHRMIAGLQPKLLTTIVSATLLRDLYVRLNKVQVEGVPSYTGDWFVDSHSMMIFFREQLNDYETLEIATYPWQVKTLLENHSNKIQKINMEKEDFRDRLVSTLSQSRNLILNGAPGTGKTFLAQKIAEEIVKQKGGDLSKNIVRMQFHPSLDYTDFVEGLRPVKGGSESTIGFERKDGIFKEFCMLAATNYTQSKTSVKELKVQQQSKERVDAFLESAIETEQEITKSTKNSFFKLVFTDDEDKVKIWSTDVRGEYFEFPKKQLYDCFEQNKIWDTSKEMWKEVYGKSQTQQATYILNIIKEITKQTVGMQNESATENIKQENFVFIIDEINRGEISKIFGELFLSIEPTYRGEKGIVKTQYQNLIEESNTFFKGFYIPENVYIIGTMNDIDRSVESMDFAMRRRFTFCEIKADDRLTMWNDTLKDMPLVIEESRVRLNNLNKEIENIQGLNDSYHIGPAYFNHLQKDKLDGDFDALWTSHISPLLKEYVRGMHNSQELMRKMKKAYDTVAND